jgi:hypothetical protein
MKKLMLIFMLITTSYTTYAEVIDLSNDAIYYCDQNVMAQIVNNKASAVTGHRFTLKIKGNTVTQSFSEGVPMSWDGDDMLVLLSKSKEFVYTTNYDRTLLLSNKNGELRFEFYDSFQVKGAKSRTLQISNGSCVFF